MLIASLLKCTLLDYPGAVAATIFTYGCNFRCPFCHNPELVVEKFSRESSYAVDEVLAFLKKRKGKLDAVCVTGGEPTIHSDLGGFLECVKSLGYKVKLDTQGSYPEKLPALDKFVDYWAMDIKNSPEKYSETSGVEVDLSEIKKSIKFIKNSGKKYEFRTTVVPGLHDVDSVRGIGELIKGAETYSLQNFRAGKTIDKSFSKLRSFTRSELQEFEKIMLEFVDEVVVRNHL